MKGFRGVRRQVAVLALVGPLVSGCAADVPVVQVEAQPSPTPSAASPSPSPASSATALPSEPTPTATATATATATGTATPRPATDTDRARFVAGFQPEGASDLQHVATDLDGDGTEELVFSYVQEGAAHVDIGWWDGTAYGIVFSDSGGRASKIDQVTAADVNADGRVEIVTFQSGEGSRASLTMWQVPSPRQVVGLHAVGGCHDGSKTYGVVGATLEDRDADGVDEIYATCDDTPLPVSAWSTDRYEWEAGAYRHSPDLTP